MKSKIIQVGGRPELVEWWDKDDFKGRFNMFMPADEQMRPDIKDPKDLEIDPVDDDCIICDYCNRDLDIFPVPVVGGNALCQDCFKAETQEARA